MLIMMTSQVVPAILLCALLAAPLSHAQSLAYPAKPVRLIVAYPPGGTSDIVGRALAQAMGARLGQGFIVENRSGARGPIGPAAAAKAAPAAYPIPAAASRPISSPP